MKRSSGPAKSGKSKLAKAISELADVNATKTPLPCPPLYAINLTDDELHFLLYVMGYMLASTENMEMKDAHREYIRRHHWTVMPKLIETTKRKP